MALRASLTECPPGIRFRFAEVRSFAPTGYGVELRIRAVFFALWGIEPLRVRWLSEVRCFECTALLGASRLSPFDVPRTSTFAMQKIGRSPLRATE